MSPRSPSIDEPAHGSKNDALGLDALEPSRVSGTGHCHSYWHLGGHYH